MGESEGFPRIEGHKAGIEAVRQAVSAASNLGIRYLTLYAFSVENWKRPATEVRALFRLLQQFLKSEAQNIEKNRIRFRTIGRTTDLPRPVQALLSSLEARTKNSGACTLTLALSYGGRNEIADACEAIVRETLAGRRSGRVSEGRRDEAPLRPGSPGPGPAHPD